MCLINQKLWVSLFALESFRSHVVRLTCGNTYLIFSIFWLKQSRPSYIYFCRISATTFRVAAFHLGTLLRIQQVRCTGSLPIPAYKHEIKHCTNLFLWFDNRLRWYLCSRIAAPLNPDGECGGRCCSSLLTLTSC